jgi:hypothetical protein
VRPHGTSYKSNQIGVFNTSVLGIATLIISFGATLIILDSQTPQDTSRNLGPQSELTIKNGLRLIFPVTQQSSHLPDRAFDSSIAPDSFWEAPGPFPIDLTIQFPQPTTLSSYSLDAGEDASRMPSEWSIDGKLNEHEWILLDQQKIKNEWKRNEIRQFNISHNQPLLQLRLRFIAGLNRSFLRIYEIELH